MLMMVTFVLQVTSKVHACLSCTKEIEGADRQWGSDRRVFLLSAAKLSLQIWRPITLYLLALFCLYLSLVIFLQQRNVD